MNTQLETVTEIDNEDDSLHTKPSSNTNEYRADDKSVSVSDRKTINNTVRQRMRILIHKLVLVLQHQHLCTGRQ
jgi:hypothetical protein